MMRDQRKSDGVRFLIESLADIEEEFELLVVGDGPFRDELAMLGSQKLGDKVRFLGV